MATPAGIKPIYVSNKQKEKYGLTDGITHKLFKKNESLEEAQTMGFYSLFHEIKAELQVGLAFLFGLCCQHRHLPLDRIPPNPDESRDFVVQFAAIRRNRNPPCGRSRSQVWGKLLLLFVRRGESY